MMGSSGRCLQHSRKNTEIGSASLTTHLTALLSRDDVNARSDDDKTLILAVNVPVS